MFNGPQGTATLLSIIGIPRRVGIHMLTLGNHEDHGDRHIFKLAGLVKNQKTGLPEPIVYHSHKEDKRICPVSCLEGYTNLTKPWRDSEGNPDNLFLSYVSPHKPIGKSRIAGWVKETLFLADIDTKIFQAHSIRGAATSKAFLKGLSVKEVIDHGKWHCASTWQKFYHKKIEKSNKKVSR